MTKTFDAICNKILGETLMVATPSPNQPKPGQPVPPPKPGQPPTPTQPGQPVPNQTTPAVDPNRIKKITDSLSQLNDPAHLEAVEKLLAGLNTQNPNAANK